MFDVLLAEPWSPAGEDSAGVEAAAARDRARAGRAASVAGYG
jgi:hypothetical protein